MKTFNSIFALIALTIISCKDNLEQPVPVNSPEVNDGKINNNLSNARQSLPIPNQYIVVLKEDLALKGKKDKMQGKIKGLLKRLNVPEENMKYVYETVLQGFSCKLSSKEVEALRKYEEIDYIEPDIEIALEDMKPEKKQNQRATLAQSIPWGVGYVGGVRNGTGKVAWIIDTGIDLTHPDLNIDNTRGFSAYTSGQDVSRQDFMGHGTFVAGVIGAKDNDFGVVGIAANATVIPVKVISSTTGTGTAATLIAGLNYVAANCSVGDVANISLTCGTSIGINNAVKNLANLQKAKIVMAAGNNNASASLYSPGSTNHAFCYTVSAMNSQGIMTSFSNYGTPVDFAAPGYQILSTYLQTVTPYATFSGTSGAAPHVAGIILMIGQPVINGYITGDKDTVPDPKASL